MDVGDEVDGATGSGLPRPVQSFAAPWTRKGKQVLLACGKCQRKLKGGRLSKLKKALKKHGRASGNGVELAVIETKCLDVCPRGGVVVCTQAQLGAGRASILRSKDDLDLLLQECAAMPRESPELRMFEPGAIGGPSNRHASDRVEEYDVDPTC